MMEYKIIKGPQQRKQLKKQVGITYLDRYGK